MSRKSVLSLLLLVFPLLLSESAPAGGGSVRGGGSMIFANGHWQLSEVLQRKGDPSLPVFQLSTGVKSFIDNDLKEILGAYLPIKNSGYWQELTGDLADFRLVDSLPCGKIAADSRAPAPAHEEIDYGCTANGITYLIASEFTKLRSVDQLLAILHQRAHAFDPNDDAHDWIFPFVSGIEAIISLAIEQEKGNFRELRPDEIRAIRDMVRNPLLRKRLQLAGYTNDGLTAQVLKRGGGLVLLGPGQTPSSFEIDDASWVSAGSRIVFDSRQCDGRSKTDSLSIVRSTIVRSELDCVELENSKVFDSTVSHSVSDYRPNSLERLFRMLTIRSTTSIRDSIIENSSLNMKIPATVENHSEIQNSVIRYEGSGQVFVQNSSIVDCRFQMELHSKNARFYGSTPTIRNLKLTGKHDF